MCPHRPACAYPGFEPGTCFRPLHDRHYPEQRQKWLDGLQQWNENRHPYQLNADGTLRADHSPPQYDFWEYDDPPDRERCVPYAEGDCSWLQVYETVSKGTPVTPAFATEKELADYLVANGDYWDQRRAQDSFFQDRSPPQWTREQAEAFLKAAAGL